MLKYNDETCEITYNGKVIATWNDDAHCDYPEDLTWARTIGGLADKCFMAGMKEAQAENARLREALEHIASDDPICDQCNEDLERHFFYIARKALNDLRKGGE
jgi:hypothetical protein